MKKTDLSNVEANVRGLILEDKTLQHIFESYQEGYEALLKALNCDPAEITILSGAVADGSGDPDYSVTAGWAAYGGEIFQVDAVAFTASGGETAVWNIETTYPASDPVKFDDGNEFNINQIRKLKLESGVAGSGEKDWDDTQSLNDRIYSLLDIAGDLALKANKAQEAWTNLTLTNGWVLKTGKTPQYRKNQFGMVELRGALDAGSSSSSIIATLPVGYRPDVGSGSGPSFVVSGTGGIKTIQIGTSGAGVISMNASDYDTAADISLDGISFSVDNY